MSKSIAKSFVNKYENKVSLLSQQGLHYGKKKSTRSSKVNKKKDRKKR